MSTATWPVDAPGSGRVGRSVGRVVVAVLVAGLVAALAAAVGATGGGPSGDPVVATPRFAPGTEVRDSEWGNVEAFGVAGSRILAYRHDTSVEMTVPWEGTRVVSARLGDGDVHLATVTDVAATREGVAVTLHLDNCRYFHERAIDVFTGLTLGLANGGTAAVRFDRPLFVKSPMLASCPDRTLDRQDDTWGSYRRGG